ncbi:hypothetical protein PspLS_05202 [Pyricularia sp. CBS 133598]|nr:hypothetical protein PspLS_05202 [Pyricularia sp. CBS 133598]
MAQSGDIFNISDFAKDLLLQMKFGADGNKHLEIGKVPIIFVVHSMGGLVFKKAFILGRNDPQFQGIVDTICSVIFLATPHRGSGLAGILQKFLSASFHSPKQYVADLQRNSPSIIDINEQFRFHASQLEIVSFFETMQSSIGPRKLVIVERDSAVLGYPNEISCPMNADHHTVCKYSSRQDANYVNVRNVIGNFVSKFKIKGTLPKTPEKGSNTDKLLGISRRSSTSEILIRSKLVRLIEPVDAVEDLDLIQQREVPGSCDWILSEPNFVAWASDCSLRPSVLHLTGLPGSGKSVLASFLTQHFKTKGGMVQHFFFRFDSQAKRSIRNCLLSIVFQLALQLPEYGQRITSLLEDRNSIIRSDVRSIWQKAFLGILPKINDLKPMYWIIDAVDESESPQTLLNLLLSLQDTGLSIRITLFSRPHSVPRIFDKLKTVFAGAFHHGLVEAPNSAQKLYIEQEFESSSVMWDTNFTSHVKDTLLSKCHGNLLWLRLVVERLLQCDTEDDVDRALVEAPSDLVDLYARIVANITKDLKAGELDLARVILSWVTCSVRQLSLEELSQALHKHRILNLKHTIGRLCGDLVIVDEKNTVRLVHQTAKEFLTQEKHEALFVDPSAANEDIFEKCLTVLMDPGVRISLKSHGCVNLLRYACLSWSIHVSRVENPRREHIHTLVTFFRSRAVLTWIGAIGMTGALHTLTSTSKHLMVFLDRQRKQLAEEIPMRQPLEEMATISSWATELVRIVGKFGHHITRHPDAIHAFIPSFCPPESNMAKQFSTKTSASLRVTGISNPSWDDSLAKFNLGSDCRPRNIACIDGHFAILTSKNNVNLYHSSTFQEEGSFPHGERIMTMKFNQEGDQLVTCGQYSVKIWSVASARKLHDLPNPQGLRAIEASFPKDSTQILIICDDSSLRCQELSLEHGWKLIARKSPDESLSGTPRCALFNPQGAQVAMSFRAKQLMVWSVESGNLIGSARRAGETKKSRQDAWCYAQRLTWNPITGHVLGIYNDGSIFKWYPLDPESQEPEPVVVATEIACSPDGRLFITATRNGSLWVWNFETFTLLHHLSCASPVTAMTLSPDSRRIYDLRESHCNVWEPNSLIRMADADEIDSEASRSRAGSATISLASETSAVILEPITALATGKSNTNLAFCNQAGILTVVPCDGSPSLEVACSPLGFFCLSLSSDELLLATAEIVGRVAVRRAPSAADTSMTKICEITPPGPVLQLLFDQTGGQILIKCAQSVSTWSVPDGFQLGSRVIENERDYWILNPFSENQLLSVSPRSIVSVNTSNLTTVQRWHISFEDLESTHADPVLKSAHRPSASYSTCPLEAVHSVDKLFLSPENSFIFVQTSHRLDQGRCLMRLFILDTSFLQDSSNPDNASSVLARSLPAPVVERLEIPMGLVLDDIAVGTQKTRPRITSGAGLGGRGCSLAFLDREFWLCTWSLDDYGGLEIRRHFFLPRDWINMSCLRMAKVTEDGSFVCPRNGELAVVSNGLRQQWAE